MHMQNAGVSWFDLVVLAMAVLGVIRGRKHGISEELLTVIQWLAILGLGAYTYKEGGSFLHDLTGLGLTSSHIVVYLATAAVLKLLFSWLRRLCGDKLLTSDAFGSAEYPLGMVAGVIRYLCIILFFLSLINAVYVIPAEKAAYTKMQNDVYGKTYFPSLGGIQDNIFKDSFAGRQVKKYLPQVLMDPVVNQQGPALDTLKKKRQGALDDAINPK